MKLVGVDGCKAGWVMASADRALGFHVIGPGCRTPLPIVRLGRRLPNDLRLATWWRKRLGAVDKIRSDQQVRSSRLANRNVTLRRSTGSRSHEPLLPAHPDLAARHARSPFSVEDSVERSIVETRQDPTLHRTRHFYFEVDTAEPCPASLLTNPLTFACADHQLEDPLSGS